MRKEAKKYLSLYLLQHTKIQRLQGQIALYPQKAEQYRALIEDAEGLRREIEEKIEKSTIPFFEVPKILVVTKNNKDIKVPDKLDLDIDFVDINLSKLFKVI